MQSLALIHEAVVIDKGTSIDTRTRISVEYDQLWAAEATVKKFHATIGLQCCTVMRDFYCNGPKGPALLVLVATTGEGWRRGVYLCMVEDADTEPMFFLDDGESFADLSTICATSARQWQYPFPKNQHFPQAIDHAEKSVINLLSH